MTQYRKVQRGLRIAVLSATLLWAVTGTAQQCPGDLNYDSRVTVDELVTAVKYAFEGCPLLDSRFVDNGDGTITDNETGLMWEKKSDDGGLHDWDRNYPWSDSRTETIWDWLHDVNAEGGTGFAGYNDWRIPNVRELQSIIDHGRKDPAVDPVFHTGCRPGCTVTRCSCTQSDVYWSSTPHVYDSGYAWYVFFHYGSAYGYAENLSNYVRAVRGGL